MKALVPSQLALNVRPVHVNVKSATERRGSESSRVSKPSVGSFAPHEHAGRRPVANRQDDLTRRKCRNQLVNSWLALKRHTATSSATVKRDDTTTVNSDMPAGPDVNGNRECGGGGGRTGVNQTTSLDALSLPMDPRTWSPSDVECWVDHMTLVHGRDVDRSFFHMNGRGLCLMTVKGFIFRVPDYGQLMYNDFRERLRRSLPATAGPSANVGDPQFKQAGTETRAVDNRNTSFTSTAPLDLSSSPLDLTCRKSPLTYHTL